jgi:hypothetical protein
LKPAFALEATLNNIRDLTKNIGFLKLVCQKFSISTPQLYMSASTTSAPETIITLNVGGTKYQTTRDTLGNMEVLDGAKQPNYFTVLLERSPATQTEFFIDRNPRFFAFILDYMRQGCSVENVAAAFPDCVYSLLTPNENAHANLRATMELRAELVYYCLNYLAWQVIKIPNTVPLPDNSFLFFFAIGHER